MKQADIKAMSNEKLIETFYRTTINSCHETNSIRGLTKKTIQREKWIIEEMCKRFNMDLEILRKEMHLDL